MIGNLNIFIAFISKLCYNIVDYLQRGVEVSFMVQMYSSKNQLYSIIWLGVEH